ncbi:DoxX family membrane protein [Clostridium arbusti]|jgi:thiosulfate dehydrogenase [quinone] large subunit|uniref:DoxX family membrane protein n=1 Tax=Clostridium arbusti TaxID=1137848 RepID=UPI000288B1D4|nr:DoxX family membrane protein [Clostridium arbusti]
MKIFRDKRFSIIWTVLRVWLGYQWLTAGIAKVTGQGWIGSKAGVSITGFLKGALSKATGEHPLVQGWYASFIKSFALPNAEVFSYLVAFGEILVGISLILGALTIIGLIAGAFMNLNYMLAGTTSTNPILYTAAILLMVAGTNAYILGLDRFILPRISSVFYKK